MAVFLHERADFKELISVLSRQLGGNALIVFQKTLIFI